MRRTRKRDDPRLLCGGRKDGLIVSLLLGLLTLVVAVTGGIVWVARDYRLRSKKLSIETLAYSTLALIAEPMPVPTLPSNVCARFAVRITSDDSRTQGLR